MRSIITLNMKNKKIPKTQKSPSQTKNSIEEFFERLGTPIEDVTKEMAGTTMIIGVNKLSQASDGNK